ncbi:ABC transporter ATP-binding protein/permease [Phenylobacterium sp. LjRoot164]|uniref:ABC transporter ATP-binding protein n=1 Tax=unclassified Phenylobacterium TaxID=2640670 RepID=UPI003ED159D7
MTAPERSPPSGSVWSLIRSTLSGPVLGWLSVTIAAVGIGGAGAALAPLALKHLVDAATLAPPKAAGALAAYVALVGAQRLAEQAQALAFGRAELRMVRAFAVGSFEGLLRLPLATHQERRSGSLAAALVEAIAGLRVILGHLLLTGGPLLVLLTVGSMMLRAELGARLAGVLLGAVLVYGAVFAFASRRLLAPARRLSASSIDASGLLADGLINIEALKACTAEQLHVERYLRGLVSAEGHARRLLTRRLEGGLAASVVFAAAVAVSLHLVLGDVAAGELSIGDLVLVSAFLVTVLRPMEMLGFALRDVGQARAQLAPLTALLDMPMEAQAPQPGRSPPNGAKLEFDGVDFAFRPGRQTLSAVSFRLQPGETVALVGPSGAGKSAIVRLILGFASPDRGVVRLDGTPITELGLPVLRRQVALAPQQPLLLSDSLAANIALGVDQPDAKAVAAAAAAAGLGDLIARLPGGLDAPVGERGMLLSGGERQRVVIARALLRRPPLLILDEATSALDAASEAAIWAAVQAHSATTRLVVTHSPSMAARADRVLVLEDGRIVEAGPPAELLRRAGPYRRLWIGKGQSPAQG